VLERFIERGKKTWSKKSQQRSSDRCTARYVRSRMPLATLMTRVPRLLFKRLHRIIQRGANVISSTNEPSCNWANT
jgi:hypothetical protein